MEINTVQLPIIWYKILFWRSYLQGEVRFLSVMKQYPDEAEELFAACQEMAKKRYQSYVRMTKMDWSE